MSHIRTATLDDAASIADLITQLGYPTAADAMRTRLEAIAIDPDYATFVAIAGGAIVGMVGARLGRYYEKDGAYCQVVVLAVASGARRQGIGRQLVGAVERWCACRGGRDLVVTSAFHRSDAHTFYERCGYARTGLRFVKRMPRAAPPAGTTVPDDTRENGTPTTL